MKTRTKRSLSLRLLSLCLLISVLVNPASTVLASDADRSVSAQDSVTASAVIVPARVAQLGLLISGIAKDVPVKEGDSIQAGQTLLVLDSPELEFAVIEAEAALRSAQAYADLQKYRRVENKRKGQIYKDVIPAVYRQRADARVQQAQVTLELAQINLAESTLTAPFNGTVASLAVIPGEYIEADQAIVTLATLDSLQLETTDLTERDITKVKLDMPVDIFIEALNEHFPGKVIGISPRADSIGGDVVFKVTIAFDQQPKNLLWGMTAEVSIEE